MTKSKAKISDFGGQDIIKGENGKLYRLPDYQEIEYVEQAKDPKRLELKYKDLLHWYFKQGALYPKDKELNETLYAVGYRYQDLYHRAGYVQKTTAVLMKDHIQADIEETLNTTGDCQTAILKANRELKNYVPIIIQVLIDNQPARKHITKFREGLQVLADHWDYK